MKSLNYIAVEGVIGAGKTTLATILARRMNGRLILEKHDENPFLPDFYKDPARYAFQTQMFFLLSRYRQQLDLRQRDLFHQVVVSDYIFQKDRIFAVLTLDDREYALYEKVARLLERDILKPDLVIYLQASTRRLMANIRRRGRPYEKSISEDYIRSLVEAYNHFFFHYTATPLLIVNMEGLDFVHNNEQLEDLLSQIMMPLGGTKYYNPLQEKGAKK
jgi:deoxyadenosine/deoxycytidine kinase